MMFNEGSTLNELLGPYLVGPSYPKAGTLHKDDLETFEKLSRVAFFVSRKLGLGLRSFVPMPRPSPVTYTGRCWFGPSRIELTVRYRYPNTDRWAKNVRGKWMDLPLPIEKVLRTLAHELAHLKHYDHSPAFKSYADLLCAPVFEAWENFAFLSRRGFLPIPRKPQARRKKKVAKKLTNREKAVNYLQTLINIGEPFSPNKLKKVVRWLEAK